MQKEEILTIAKTVIDKIDSDYIRKIQLEMRMRKFVVCRTSPLILNKFDKLYTDSAIDIRYLCLVALVNEIISKNIQGDIAELGVFKANFAIRMHALLPDRDFYLFDTFQGFVTEEFTKEAEKYNLPKKSQDEKRFNDTSLEKVLEKFEKFLPSSRERLKPCQGHFPETAKTIKDKQFALVSLDADLYEPMKNGLEFFYPRLTPGGYIIIHDFINAQYPGTHDAVYEYVRDKHLCYIPLPDRCGSVVISKSL